MKILVLRAVAWPLLATFDVVARLWTLLGSTSRRKAHRLADSATARQACHAAEARLCAIAHAYAETTPLVLRFLVVDDHCTRGLAGWDLFTPVRRAFRVSCWMRLTAYYSSPLPPTETITRILDAGEHALSGIPFTHSTTGEKRRGELDSVGHALTWDQPASPVPEPEQPAHAYRFTYEPSAANVGGIRRQHGTVFMLTLPPEDYYRIPR
ncbi:hypothetical protein CP966_33830 [Streptomyces galilaeus]|uniref:hypothetical protein n=1 Tax=Streptomyces galilaeus TaxID=33899 RepID=UPI00123D075A|nr:hypothetical protein [Streptomyces galilaeus]QEU69683.1 hypothetical protein CP966_33830 [Streptomyces galilaeus]GGW87288.1 hypothetical protein GCM10010350_84470 [Streptomyces galilaeus]